MDVQQQTEPSSKGSQAASAATDSLQDPLQGSGLSDPLASASSGPPPAAPSAPAAPSGGPGNLFSLPPVQGNVGGLSGGDPQGVAHRGVSGSGGPLPHSGAIQESFGSHDISGISAHTGSKAVDAATELGAQGYATGDSVALKNTDLHTSAHEAAHVVQQRAGVSLKGGVGAAGDSYERHADQVADAVVAGRSAQSLLDSGPSGGGGGGVQLQQDPARAVNQVATSMDDVSSMKALQAKLGFLLDTLAPNADMSRKVEVGIALKVHPALSIGFKFSSELSRTGGKLKMRTGIGFEAKAEADAWLATAFAKVNFGGFLEAVGDSGTECMHLVGAALYNAVAAVSTDAAEVVWGERYLEDVRARMDHKDHVEAGITGGVEVGVRYGEDDDPTQAQVAVGAKGGVSKHFGKHGSKVNTEAMAYFSGSLKLPGSSFAGKLDVEAGQKNGRAKGFVQLKADRTANAAEFMKQVADGKIGNLLTAWVSGAASGMRGLILNKMNPDLGGGRKLGSILTMMGGASMSATVGSAALAERVAGKLEGFGAKLAQRLDIKLHWDGGPPKLDVSLDRVSTFDLKKDLKAASLEVMIETITRLINIPTIQF